MMKAKTTSTTTATPLILLTLLAAAVASIAPALAGEGEKVKQKKCAATAEACIRGMSEDLRNRGWVGIEMAETDADGRPVVSSVVAGSPAEKAGFAPGDVLVAFNGVPHAKGEEAVNSEVKRSLVPGGEITMSVLRDGRKIELAVVLGRIPDYLLAQWIGQHMLEGHGDGEPAPPPRP